MGGQQLSAAVDPRVTKSFPVAGSYPLYLSDSDWGDYEQNVASLYGRVNYLEIFILGAYGKDRKQLQVYNEFDECCFSGTRWMFYRDTIQSKVSGLGKGNIDVLQDSTHVEHKISDYALERILKEMNE